MEETIEIPVKVYKKLVAAQDKLYALEAGGVDNWEGYDFSMEEFFKDEEEEQE